MSVFGHSRDSRSGPSALHHLWHPLDRALPVPLGPQPHKPSKPSPGAVTLGSHCCVAGGRRASAHSREGCGVAGTAHGARCCCPKPHCAEHGESPDGVSAALPPTLPPLSLGPARQVHPAYLAPLRPPPSGPEGSGRRLQRMVAGGLAAGWLVRGGSVGAVMRSHRGPRGGGGPGPQLGVHCSWEKGVSCSVGALLPLALEMRIQWEPEDGRIASFWTNHGGPLGPAVGAPGGGGADVGPPGRSCLPRGVEGGLPGRKWRLTSDQSKSGHSGGQAGP